MSEKGQKRRVCCCCVVSVNMGSMLPTGFVAGQVGVPNFVIPFINAASFGHNLYVQIVMNFSPGSTGSDCSLRWLERTDNVPPFLAKAGYVRYAWNDGFALYPQSPVFDPWRDRVSPCPVGGPLVVTLLDSPALGLGTPPGRTKRRVLDIDVVVTSGALCDCPFRSKHALGSQTLWILNGVITLQTFTIRQNNV